ncbi:MAG TPA: CRISPR system precrRNA processing endoribonuclease RAMP protein Cas6 [Candidatus Nocardiopsis merdipullorum]|nr:CRISPR system precrRNA processing endoribonuclease RAMP protein Cas6 [Candidatus Nocardiopsis merdipullorum]
MPTQWTLFLSPPPPSCVLPTHLHAAACAAPLESSGEDHAAQTKPFTAALTGQRLTLGRLDESTSPDLPARLREPLRLGEHTAAATLIDQRFEAYTRMASAPPTPRAAISFDSPTYVNQGGCQFPLPVPELLLAGLARRWEVFSPQPLPPSALSEAVESAHLVRHDIRTTAAGAGSHRRTGFVGRVMFGLPTRMSRRTQRVFAALWSFAAFSGVGTRATHGLGHVRVRLDAQASIPEGPKTIPDSKPSPLLSERSF